MKKLFVTMVASVAMLSAQAQLFSPEALGGAMWGSLIGGMAGADCHDSFSGEGAAIGAGVGLLVGALAGEARRNDYRAGEPVVCVPAPAVNFGYGYGSCGSSAYVYYAPNSFCAPGYYYRPTRANYAVSGTVLGAASGALIGSASEQAGKGAAIGAAAGLVLGGVAELATQQQEKHSAAASGQTIVQATAVTAAGETQDSRPLTQDSRCEVTSKPCATSTYTWTPRPQIADAPRVPDAPTF
jgi:uncharacterized protein YcfJ